jgi:hypothetical protein
MKKKILLILDGEKREIEADYFDFSISTGIGQGYDFILSIASAAEGEQQVLEPLYGVVPHPLKNAVSTDLPSTLDFKSIGLTENLDAMRSLFKIKFLDTEFEKEKAITSQFTYTSPSYTISIPNVFETVLRDLVIWEKDSIKERFAKITIEPKVVFKNLDRTEFIVLETILVQTGIVENEK